MPSKGEGYLAIFSLCLVTCFFAALLYYVLTNTTPPAANRVVDPEEERREQRRNQREALRRQRDEEQRAKQEKDEAFKNKQAAREDDRLAKELAEARLMKAEYDKWSKRMKVIGEGSDFVSNDEMVLDQLRKRKVSPIQDVSNILNIPVSGILSKIKENSSIFVYDERGFITFITSTEKKLVEDKISEYSTTPSEQTIREIIEAHVDLKQNTEEDIEALETFIAVH